MTNAIILHVGNVNLELLNVKKPYKLTDITVFDIKYNNTPFLVQTPLCVLKYKPAIYDNGYMQISVHVLCDECRQFVETLEGKIISKLSKKYKTITDTFVRFDKDLKLRSNNHRNVKVFDAFNSNNDIHALTKDEKLCFILHISKVISMRDKAYIMYEIVQIKRFEGFQSMSALFTQSHSNIVPETMPLLAPEYDKFVKMHKVGIPLECIKHKMNLDGLPVDSINTFLSFINNAKSNVQKVIPTASCAPARSVPPGSSPPPPPPPPPPPKLFNAAANQKSPLAFLNDIKNKTFQLKKVTVDSERGGRREEELISVNKNGDLDKTSRVLKNVKSGNHKVPSLQEILAAKDKLRKNSLTDKPPPKEFYAMPFHKDIKEFTFKLKPVQFPAKRK